VSKLPSLVSLVPDIRQRLDAIDAETTEGAARPYWSMWSGEKRGQWLKGKLIIEAYPDIEEYEGKRGRPDNSTDHVLLTWDRVARETGRDERTIQKWVRLVATTGQKESDLKVWLEEQKPKQLERLERRQVGKPAPEPPPPMEEGTYRIIYADPPWLYSSMQHSKEEQETTLDTHYKQMPTDAIAGLPVKKWLPSDAVLFLWTTSPKLYEASDVIDGWGFEYKASIVWDKVKHNVGYYVSVRHEFLLICTRGSCLPDVKKLEDSVVSIERGEHSTKPPYFREWIDRMYLPTDGRIDRIEMFPRGEIPTHWARWGGES